MPVLIAAINSSVSHETRSPAASATIQRGRVGVAIALDSSGVAFPLAAARRNAAGGDKVRRSRRLVRMRRLGSAT